jgi:hypothetical protein
MSICATFTSITADQIKQDRTSWEGIYVYYKYIAGNKEMP